MYAYIIVSYLHKCECAVRVFVIIFVSRHAMSIVHSSLLFHSCRCCSTIECYGSVTRAVATRLCSSGVSETDNNSNNNYSNWLLFHFLCTLTRTHTPPPQTKGKQSENRSLTLAEAAATQQKPRDQPIDTTCPCRAPSWLPLLHCQCIYNFMHCHVTTWGSYLPLTHLPRTGDKLFLYGFALILTLWERLNSLVSLRFKKFNLKDSLLL